MAISSSTCHICLDELDFDLKYITKKCCPTKAFICNECWEKVLDAENIIHCPLCNAPIKEGSRAASGPLHSVAEEGLGGVEAPRNNSFIIEIDSPTPSVSVSSRSQLLALTNKFLTIFIQILLITILGFVAITTTIYFIHPESITFKAEINFVIVKPFFWLMCPVYGFVIFCIVSLCLEVAVGGPVIHQVQDAHPQPFNMRNA